MQRNVNSVHTTINQRTVAPSHSSGLEMAQPSGSGVNPYSFMALPGQNMFNIAGMENYCQYGMIPTPENIYFPPVKEVIQLSKGVLYPPNLGSVEPTILQKPVGCKIVFVSGLPEKATEEIIKEIFEKCGTIEIISMSNKFCRIKFSDQLFAEYAMYFSGYWLKIENKDEASYIGKLHVDYPQTKDDQYDYNSQQMSLQCQAHQENDSYRTDVSPVFHYTDHEAMLVTEKLKHEETFSQAASILISWLRRGECTNENSEIFYSMIQSTHNHIRKLLLDKFKYEEQLNDTKNVLKKELEGIIKQFIEIEKIFKAASLQKCWDHFTKAQRKNIEMWRKQTEELKSSHVEVINVQEDEEMELSGDESDDKNNKNADQIKSELKRHIQKLKEEGDSLRCQLEAVQTEIMIMQSDHEEELKRKDNQIAAIEQALQNPKDILNLSLSHTKEEAELKELCAIKCNRRDDNKELTHDSNNLHLESGSCGISMENEARLIGLISTFLHVHPFGANIDYICSYLHQIDPTIKSRDVEDLMKRFPTIYREDSVGVGASLEKKWFFTGFQT